MGQGVPCHVQVFQTVVEHGRIAAAVIDDGKDFFQVREITGSGFAFPGIEPVYIPLDGIDFPVVDDIAVRMGPGPAGEGIGAETGMDECHGCRKIQVGQVQIKMAQLDRGQHAFIDNRPRRQTGDVEIGALFLAGRDDLLFCHLADDIQFAFKIHRVGKSRILADKDLQEMRPDRLGDAPDEAFIDRYVTPAEDGQAFFVDDFFEFFHLFLAECFIAVGKNHADAVFPFRRQGKAQDVTFTAEKLMRYLYENPLRRRRSGHRRLRHHGASDFPESSEPGL